MSDTLFIEMVHSPGLAHLSYMVGHDGFAAVIDPRRDVEVYLGIARKHGCRITHIFETHRNEDYVIGSVELQRLTEATILHGKGLDWGYGEEVEEGKQIDLGDLRLGVLQTPGHTFDSISITLADRSFSDDPVAVFTGDSLFLGDVGRTDFYPDRAAEVAGLLYDSIYEKLLPLGDHVLLYPAHGAGSVCGSGMASREFSSLGYERRHNPALQVAGRDEFIKRKLEENHYQPPYFRKMEEYNQYGNAPALSGRRKVPPISAEELDKARKAGGIILDIREPEAFAGAFVPGSLNIPKDMLAAYAGWFLSYDADIYLVPAEPADVDDAVRTLARIGYDNVAGYLRDGLHGWETTGRPLESIGVMTARELQEVLAGSDPTTLIDVRKIDEYESGHLEKSNHVFLGDLPEHASKFQNGGKVVTFCGSGRRASIAASILRREGLSNVWNNLGSMAACKAVGCPLEK